MFAPYFANSQLIGHEIEAAIPQTSLLEAGRKNNSPELDHSLHVAEIPVVHLSLLPQRQYKPSADAQVQSDNIECSVPFPVLYSQKIYDPVL